MVPVNIEELPRPILEQAVMLSDPLKKVYLALIFLGKPASAKEIAEEVSHARAYIHMRLIELEQMGIIKRIRERRNIKFEVIK